MRFVHCAKLSLVRLKLFIIHQSGVKLGAKITLHGLYLFTVDLMVKNNYQVLISVLCVV